MSLAHSPSIPLDGLLLCVDAANSKLPAYGNTTLTSVGGIAAPANGYYTFDGVDDSITIDTNVYNTVYTGKTINVAVWVDPGWTTTGYKGMIGTAGSQTLRNFNFYLYRDATANTTQLHFSQGTGSTNIGTLSNTFTMTAGQWYVVGVSMKADGSHTYYLNGQIINSNTMALTQYNAGTIESLGRADNLTWGRIAYWHVYSRGLTDSEMKQSFNAMRGRFGL